MTRRLSVFALLVLALGLSSMLPVASAAPGRTPASERTTTSSRSSALTAAQFERKLLALTNARRKKVGCPAVKSNSKLTLAARRHSILMAAYGNLSHQLPREAGLASRIQKTGYKRWTRLAENVAWGPNSPTAIFNLWLNSAGHRANIQNCSYRDAGFGVVSTKGHPWVTMDLGRRR